MRASGRVERFGAVFAPSRDGIIPCRELEHEASRGGRGPFPPCRRWRLSGPESGAAPPVFPARATSSGWTSCPRQGRPARERPARRRGAGPRGRQAAAPSSPSGWCGAESARAAAPAGRRGGVRTPRSGAAGAGRSRGRSPRERGRRSSSTSSDLRRRRERPGGRAPSSAGAVRSRAGQSSPCSRSVRALAVLQSFTEDRTVLPRAAIERGRRASTRPATGAAARSTTTRPKRPSPRRGRPARRRGSTRGSSRWKRRCSASPIASAREARARRRLSRSSPIAHGPSLVQGRSLLYFSEGVAVPPCGRGAVPVDGERARQPGERLGLPFDARGLRVRSPLRGDEGRRSIWPGCADAMGEHQGAEAREGVARPSNRGATRSGSTARASCATSAESTGASSWRRRTTCGPASSA